MICLKVFGKVWRIFALIVWLGLAFLSIIFTSKFGLFYLSQGKIAQGFLTLILFVGIPLVLSFFVYLLLLTPLFYFEKRFIEKQMDKAESNELGGRND